MNTETNKHRINREDSIAIIIDVQERLIPFIYQKDIIIQNMTRLINGLITLNIPLILTQQYTKGLGSTVPEIKNLIPDLSHIEKNSFSCCGEEMFMKYTEFKNKSTAILMGIESHVCVLQTALDLINHNYKTVIVEDCVSSRKENDKKIAIERMRSEGAIITTYESLLFELTVVSGTDEFKRISRIVK